MTQETKTKIDIFVAGVILFSFIAFISFFAAFAKDEGTIGNGIIINFIASYALYIFPLIFIAGSINFFNPVFLILLYGLNIFLYSFVAIKLCKKIMAHFKSYTPFLATYYSTILIMLIVLAHIVYLIASSE